MKKLMLSTLVIGSLLVLTSCKSDDDGGSDDCTSCTVQGAPAIEICEGENGNAFVSGQDTEVEYDGYVSALETAGATCN